MSRRKVAPWLLAASVFLGATGILGVGAPASAITSVEELRDVDTAHWAYQALADLVEKYDVIEGYPDYTFRGNRSATRWELAAALNALIKAVGRDLARLGAEKANKSDLATLARLQEEFRNELAALNARTAALESRAAAIEAKNAEQDTRLDLLEKTQLHGDFSVGGLWDFGPGVDDSVGAVGRFRLGVKVPVVPGYDDSPVGEGDVIARLVGAFGRWAPINSGGGGAVGDTIGGYSWIAGQSSSLFNEGVVPSSITAFNTGLNTRQNVFVESAYYKQHYRPGIPLLTDLFPGVNIFPDNDNYRTTADVYIGIVPWRNLFNRSPYRGDELNQFQAGGLVNNIGLLVNNITPTVAIAWHQGLGERLSADLTGAISSFNVGDLADGFSVTEELAFNYDTTLFGTRFSKPGSLYVGGYHIFWTGSTVGPALAALGLTGAPSTLNAFYTGWNQEWWRGIGTSVDWTLNQSGGPRGLTNAALMAVRNGTGVNSAFMNGAIPTGVQHSLSAALSVPMTAFFPDLTNRAKDVWGLGYALTETTVANEEHHFETFYRWTVNDSVTVVPSAQLIMNRFGLSGGPSWVIGLRTNYVF